jgi:hypothetical protein
MRSIFKTACRAVFSKLVMLLSSSVSAIFFFSHKVCAISESLHCNLTRDNRHASASEH